MYMSLEKNYLNSFSAYPLPSIQKIFKFWCSWIYYSGKKLEELYHELQSRCTAPDLIDHVEGALTSLFQDVKQVLDDNEKLKHMFHK